MRTVVKEVWLIAEVIKTAPQQVSPWIESFVFSWKKKIERKNEWSGFKLFLDSEKQRRENERDLETEWMHESARARTQTHTHFLLVNMHVVPIHNSLVCSDRSPPSPLLLSNNIKIQYKVSSSRTAWCVLPPTQTHRYLFLKRLHAPHTVTVKTSVQPGECGRSGIRRVGPVLFLT